jgi:hypothetical protein
MPLAPTKAMLQFSDCSPADGMNAAFKFTGLRQARWQLCKQATLHCRVWGREQPAQGAAGAGDADGGAMAVNESMSAKLDYFRSRWEHLSPPATRLGGG